MAIFCLSKNLEDLQQRLSKIIIGYTRDLKPVTADAVNAPGAMAVLLKDAIAPNLVQTLENNPAFIHGGPFANIAHGCNSVIATTTALKLADYVVTEAGFGADLGAEKFFDIKCRSAGLSPDAVVLVATIRALKMHGGVEKDDLGEENVQAVADGCSNLARHISNLKSYGVPVVVAINRFSADTDAEVQQVRETAAELGATAIDCTHWANGGAGTEELAQHVVKMIDEEESNFSPLYPDDMPLWDKMRTIAQKSTAPTTSLPTRKCATRSSSSRTRALVICRFASPRPSTAFPPIRIARAPPAGTWCPSVKCVCRPVPASWCLSAATS